MKEPGVSPGSFFVCEGTVTSKMSGNSVCFRKKVAEFSAIYGKRAEKNDNYLLNTISQCG